INLGERLGGVGERLLQIAGELRAQVADEAVREAAGKGDRAALGGDIFFAIVTYGVRRERAGRIEKNVVRAPIAGGIQAGRELITRVDRDINLEKSGVTQEFGWIVSGETIELPCRGEYQRLIRRLVITR